MILQPTKTGYSFILKLSKHLTWLNTAIKFWISRQPLDYRRSGRFWALPRCTLRLTNLASFCTRTLTFSTGTSSPSRWWCRACSPSSRGCLMMTRPMTDNRSMTECTPDCRQCQVSLRICCPQTLRLSSLTLRFMGSKINRWCCCSLSSCRGSSWCMSRRLTSITSRTYDSNYNNKLSLLVTKVKIYEHKLELKSI